MGKIICYCTNKCEEEILDAISNGAKNLNDVQKNTGACTGNQCKKLNPSGKCCSEDIEKLISLSYTPKACSCCCG